MKNIFLLIVLSIFLFSCTEDENEPDLGNNTNNVFPCFINQPLVLKDTNPNGIDYYITCDVSVNNELIIEPGVSIEFKANAGFRIENSGRIKAVGDSTKPIILKGVANTASWKGISIFSNDVRNELSYVNVEYAGDMVNFSSTLAGYSYDEKSAIAVYGRLNMSNCKIIGSGGHGISFSSESNSNLFKHNSIENSELFPILTYAGIINKLDLDSQKFVNNKKNYIALFSFSSNEVVENDITIKKTTIPYLAYRSLYFEDNVNIQAGVIIKVDNNQGIGINNTGILTISGNVDDEVIIEGLENMPAFWKGLYIRTTNNVFNYLIVKNGGSEEYYASQKSNIVLSATEQPSLTLNNCKSIDYEGCALAYPINTSTVINNSPEITDICTY